MFGWEFPPFNSGGLGVACEGLVKGLSKEGIKVTFVLPKKINCASDFCNIIFADDSLVIKAADYCLSPYLTSKSYKDSFRRHDKNNIYGKDLYSEVMRYAKFAAKIALSEDFDIIHCHDWLSFPAGIAAKKVSKKALVVHVHATEFDRTGGNNLDGRIYDIEKEGFSFADRVITVSNYTKNKVVNYYGIDTQKVRVVHNAIDQDYYPASPTDRCMLKENNEKIVLFVGRITLQKGPDYFLRSAKKVLDVNPNVRFLIVGSGDMEYQIIEEAAALNIADKVLFTGFLRGDDLQKAYAMADLFVLSSVSEPFGITPLESLIRGTPVLISKQSGISEVLSNCLKADFWDVDEMANKILAVLQYPELQSCLKENGSSEVNKFNWQDSARKCVAIYNELLTFYSS